MTVILSSLTTNYTFSPELDNKTLFNIDAIPYCPPRTQTDIDFLKKTKQFCYERLYEAVETGYTVILINNTPLTLEVLKELHDKTDYPNASDWTIVSFFHDDNALLKTEIPTTDTEYLDPQILLTDKSKDITSLSDYPFIKKVVIPYNFQITMAYLKTLTCPSPFFHLTPKG